MDDRLTISFGSSGGRDSRVAADSATVFREADDATRSEVVWRPQEGCGGFGEGHRYRLIREIGRGGMGAVYEGWDAQLCRSVAIKLMDVAQRTQPAGLQRFFREARIASRLSHPGIVTIHEFGVTLDGQAFIVMELLRGRTLRQVLAEGSDRAAGLPSLVAIFSHVCEAMASAHDSGIIHRDLKPSNIMVCPFGVVSVMDWGVAKLLVDPAEGDPAADAGDAAAGEDAGSAQAFGPSGDQAVGQEPEEGPIDAGQTLAGTVFGTPAYLAPEQARGEVRRVGRRSDVFGLGSILCEMLSGVAPFAAESSDDRCRLAAAGALEDAFARLDECGGPLPLVALAKRCLAADPQDRPADAEAVASAVRAYLESGQRRVEQERETLAAFAAAAGLFLTAAGSLEQRLADVAEEGVSMLGLMAMEIWQWGADCQCPRRLAAAGLAVGGSGEVFVRRIASDCQPRQIFVGSDDWDSAGGPALSAKGVASFLGYPLLFAGRPVGVLAVYAAGPLSQLHVSAMSSTLASLSLALSAG